MNQLPRIPGFSTPSKGIRIEVAENGYVLYFRKSDFTEETRIAASTGGMWYMVQNYLKEPMAKQELNVGRLMNDPEDPA